MTDDRGWLARRRQDLVDGYADRLRGRAVDAALDSRRAGGSTVALWLLAGVVHLVSVGVLAVGLWLVWIGPWLVRVPGIVVVLFGLLLLPRPQGWRRVSGLDREDLPDLFDVLDRIAALSGGPVPHVVWIDDEVNAFTTRLGRRWVLGLGAPLWVASPPAARIALLAHELGHLAHRDLLSGWWTRSAQRSLEQWATLLDETAEGGADAGTGLVLRVVTLPLRAAARATLYLVELLAASSSRQREYLADLDALQAGGTDGALALFDATLADEAVLAAVQRAALRRDDVWAEVRATLDRDDDAARSRRRAHAVRERSRVDDSHPATSQRIRVVEERPRVEPGVVVDEGTWARIDAALDPALAAAAEAMAARVRYQT